MAPMGKSGTAVCVFSPSSEGYRHEDPWSLLVSLSSKQVGCKLDRQLRKDTECQTLSSVCKHEYPHIHILLPPHTHTGAHV